MTKIIKLFISLFSSSLLFGSLSFANEDHDSHLTFYLYHSMDSVPSSKYFSRGIISVNSLKQGVFQQDGVLSLGEIQQLKKLAKEGGLYRLKAMSKSGENTQTVSTFMKASSLYESGLSDSITLTIDQAGNLIGISATAKTSNCKDISMPTDSRLSTFNTTVSIISPMNGPMPDTQTYIQRLEQEKAEKARGEQGDNRSFLAKYWMYIVPLLIFLLISGARISKNNYAIFGRK